MVKWWKPVLLSVVTFCLAVSVRNEFLFFLLGFEIMVYVASACQAVWLAKRVGMQVVIPETIVFRGDTFSIQAKLRNDSRMPVPQLMVRMAVRVFPEQDEMLLKGKLMLNGREEGKLCFRMNSSHCEAVEIRPERLVVTDFLGIFSRRCIVHEKDSSMVFVLPKTEKDLVEIPEVERNFLTENGEGDMRGNTEMNVSEIRDYREGDSLKFIHWKLSARMDELMVRELMDPAEKYMWLYLDLRESSEETKVRTDADAWDHFIETTALVSGSLLKMGKKHVVMWIDHVQSKVVSHSIYDEQTFQNMICALLLTDSCQASEEYLQLLKEIYSDETKGTCIEINLQGNLVRSERA